MAAGTGDCQGVTGWPAGLQASSLQLVVLGLWFGAREALQAGP